MRMTSKLLQKSIWLQNFRTLGQPLLDLSGVREEEKNVQEQHTHFDLTYFNCWLGKPEMKTEFTAVQTREQ
jgi:hypothetical protein